MGKLYKGGKQQGVIAKYRLVIYFKEGKLNNPSNSPRVFYSYLYLDNKGEQGKARLIRLVTDTYKKLYTTALLYDNLKGDLLIKWIGKQEELKG